MKKSRKDLNFWDKLVTIISLTKFCQLVNHTELAE